MGGGDLTRVGPEERELFRDNTNNGDDNLNNHGDGDISKKKFREEEVTTDFEEKKNKKKEEEEKMDNGPSKKDVHADFCPARTADNNTNIEMEIILSKNHEKDNGSKHVDNDSEVTEQENKTRNEYAKNLEFSEISQGTWVQCGIKTGIFNNLSQTENFNLLNEKNNDLMQFSEVNLESFVVNILFFFFDYLFCSVHNYWKM